VRSDPRYLAVISHHDGDDDNLPTLVQQPRLSLLSLALSVKALYFSPFLSVSLAIVSLIVFTRFPSLSWSLRIVPLISATLPLTWSLYSSRLSLTRKLTDPISTKLHCVSYLYAVASIYSVRNCTLPSPFPFTSRCIQYFTSTCSSAPPSIPIHLADTEKKSAVLSASRFVYPLEWRQRVEIIVQKKKRKRMESND